MTKKLEYFALGILLAPVAPLAGALLGWWSSYTFLPEDWIPYASVAGLLAGILVDVFLLRRLLDSRPSLPLWGDGSEHRRSGRKIDSADYGVASGKARSRAKRRS